jgi:serine/threonine protein kinase
MAPELLVNNITGYYTSVDWWSLGVVLFEMIFADRPFRGKNKRDNIVKGEYRMPLSKFSHISGACRAFISDLLTVDVSVRMGAGLEGMKKFRTHPFFQARWTQRLPRTEREKAATALALAEASPQDSTADKPPPPKKLNVIKPISWNKVYKKKVKPEFHPCQKRIDILSKNKKLMGEKYAEAEKIKEAERTADMNEMLEIQAQGIVPTEPAAREYIALEEKYLV